MQIHDDEYYRCYEDLLPELQTHMSKSSLRISASMFHRQPKLSPSLLPIQLSLASSPQYHTTNQAQIPTIAPAISKSYWVYYPHGPHPTTTSSIPAAFLLIWATWTTAGVFKPPPVSLPEIHSPRSRQISIFFLKTLQNFNSRQIPFKRQGRSCHDPT